MSFETLSSSHSRPPAERRRVPRAAILSDQEQQIIRDARNELRARQDRGYKDEMEDLRALGSRFNTVEPTFHTRAPLAPLDRLNNAYATQDGPGMRQISRDTQRETNELLNERREDSRRIISDDVADTTAREFRTRLQQRRDTQLADRAISESRTLFARGKNRSNELDDLLNDLNADAPAFAERRAQESATDRAPFGFRSKSESVLGKDDILDLPQVKDRASRDRGIAPSELDDLLNDLNADAPAFAERRARESATDRAPFGFRSKSESVLGKDDILDLPQVKDRASRASFESDFELDADDIIDVPETETGNRERDAKLRELRAEKKTLLEMARARVDHANALVNQAALEFLDATGVQIEEYLTGISGTMDRLRIGAQNALSALKQPWRFMKDIFSPRSGADLAPGSSPQALIEQYEHARNNAVDAEVFRVQTETQAQRLQDQIDTLTLSDSQLQAKSDAAWDRAERARNHYILGRRRGMGAGTFSALDRLSRPSGAETDDFFTPVPAPIRPDDAPWNTRSLGSRKPKTFSPFSFKDVDAL